jgi:branched-chain amino acid transport system permease protein
MPLSFSTEFVPSPAKYFKPLRRLFDSPIHLVFEVPGFIISDLISALVYGTLFALMAMGLTLTYLTTKVPNFAYGSFVMIGLYTAYQLSTLNHILPYFSSIPAFFIAGGVSVLMYIGVLRPLAKRGTPLVALTIATFALDAGFTGGFGIYTDYLQKTCLQCYNAKQFFKLPGDFTLFGLAGVVYVAPLALVAITVLLYALFTRTRFGIAMRASVENASLARVLGINVDRVYVVSWMLAGGFAGLAGSLYTLWLPGGTSTGSNVIVEIFASSILGGLTSIFGAVLGGLLIGGSENVVTLALANGFGYVGVGATAALVVIAGAFLVRKVQFRRKITGVFLVALGGYMFYEMATGFSTDVFVRGLVNGNPQGAIAFQQGIPLMLMVVTLLVIPQGLVSLRVGWLTSRIRRGRKKREKA